MNIRGAQKRFMAPVSKAALQSAVDEVIRPVTGQAPQGTRLRVSVVVPSYNQAAYLPRTLNSLLNQTYGHLEIIVIDGGSTDGTTDILREYDSQIRYWVSESDHGQSDALNKGFALATGEIFGWLNADDLYLPDAVALAMEEFTRYPDVDVVYGDHLQVDADDRVTDYMYNFPASRGQLLYEGFFANAQAMFWRRSLYLQAGPFDTELHRTMDYEMMLRFLSISGRSGFKHVARPLGCFRRHEAQKTQDFDDALEQEHRYIAARHGVKKYGLIGRGARHAYRGRRAYWYWRRGGLPLVADRLRRGSNP